MRLSVSLERTRGGRRPLVWCVLLLAGAAWCGASGAVLAQEADPADESESESESEADADSEADGEAEPIAGAKLIRWNPLISAAEVKALSSKVISELDPALKSTSLSAAQRDTIRKHVVAIARSITLQENMGSMASIVDRKIILKLDAATTTDAARSYAISELLAVIPELLVSQPEIVQYNAVLLAAKLNAKPGDPHKTPEPAPPVPHGAAHKLLLKCLADENLSLPCRIIAARGLTRYLQHGAPSSVEQADIGVGLAQALQQRVPQQTGGEWYRFRLVEGLGATQRMYDVGAKPVVVDALLKVIASPGETLFVRAAAARAISQLPFDAETNVELINHEIAKLAYQLGQAYNAAADRKESHWRQSFFLTYVAYRPATKADQEQRRWGLLFQRQARGRAQVEAAYVVVFPIAKYMLENPKPDPIPAPKLDALAEWLAKNAPASRKATPTSDDLMEAPASVDGSPTTQRPGAPAAAPLTQN